MMRDLKQVRLVLFFTQNMSLLAWERGGLFEREVALYRRLLPHLGGITFVTYGDARDLTFASRLEGIEIICNRWKLSLFWYQHYLAYVLGKHKQHPIIMKTNQVRGGELSLALARRLGKPLIARCGFLFSDHMKWSAGQDSFLARQASAMEATLFAGANRVVVTTEAMRQMIKEDYGLGEERVRVIPNYVDTELFAPGVTPLPPFPVRIIFAGRLEPQKNILALVEALAGLEVELWLVGTGTLRDAIDDLARLHGVAVRFFGVVPHLELPGLLQQATLFVLPSHWEGHPKTLLEAMSCGMPVIAGEIPALRGVVHHRDNGVLCGHTPEAIRGAVMELLGHAELREQLGKRARHYALEHLTIQGIIEQELAVLRELARSEADSNKK
ncbi:MAG: glycosyltransferase family 4 protein [Magnetococcus sp. YQC-5]